MFQMVVAGLCMYPLSGFFGLLLLLIAEMSILKHSIVITDLSIYPCNSVHFRCTHHKTMLLTQLAIPGKQSPYIGLITCLQARYHEASPFISSYNLIPLTIKGRHFTHPLHSLLCFFALGAPNKGDSEILIININHDTTN